MTQKREIVRRQCDDGTKTGPTERTGPLGGVAASLPSAVGGAAGVATAGVLVSALIGRPCASRGCASDFARSGVTTMSSCCSVVSRIWPSACAQLCPGPRQLQAGTRLVRYLNAFGSAV